MTDSFGCLDRKAGAPDTCLGGELGEDAYHVDGFPWERG